MPKKGETSSGITIAPQSRADDHAILFFERIPAAATELDSFGAQLLERIQRALSDADRAGHVERR